MNKIIEAFNLSVSGLRSCYTNEGILAGKKNFVDYWARDSLFASLGSIAIGDIEQTKKNLGLYLDNQKSSGHLPYRIISIDQFLKYLHFTKRYKKPIPNYNSTLGDKVVDQNILLPIVISELFIATNDKKYIDSVISQMELALMWLVRQDKDKDGLIEEGYLANWMDHTKKKGKTLINNILYFGALKRFIELNQELGNCELSNRYQKILDKNIKRINEVFWNENYYIDWVDTRKHHYIDTAGNLLAIINGLVDDEKAMLILNHIESYTNGSFIPKANYPFYKKRLIQPQLFLAGLADYGGYRIWIGALYAIACAKVKRQRLAEDTMKNMAESIVRDQAVYEIYDSRGNPLRRWPAYKNEVPFSWSCGVYIWAVSIIFPEYKNWIV